MIPRRPHLFIMALFILSFSILAGTSDCRAQETAEITDIAVLTGAGITEIEIKSSAPFTYLINKQSDPYHFVIDLQNTSLGRFTERMVVDKAGVFEIIPLQDENAPDVARLEVTLTVPADIEPTYKDNVLLIAFDAPYGEEAPDEEVVMEEEGKAAQGTGPAAAAEPEEKMAEELYVGEKISIDFQDVELVHVFRLIADISGYNIVVSPDVKGMFSMKLIDVPWDLALDIILRNYGLSKTVEGNIIRVAPTAVLAQEEENIARVKESQEKAGDLVTKVYPINYANVNDIMATIKDAKILTKRGFISVDERTTAIVIRDVDQKHEEYERLITVLDSQTPQVSINARIVEVTSNLSRELGIQWGALIKPDSQTTIGGTTLSDGVGQFTGEPLSINLPAAVGAGSGGTMGIGFIGADYLRALDIQLSAAESTGKGKVITNPRILTMDNEKAIIRQGKKIPYETISDQGTKTDFVDAALELIVVPHITPEGTILMKIEVNNNEADFSNTSNNVPTIDTNEIETLVLINDGDTVALGGIYKKNDTEGLSAVPGLGEIPVLGWLFKKELTTDDVTEVLVFITPTIIK